MSSNLSDANLSEPVNLLDKNSGNQLVITTAGALTVDGTATTQPVSGTVTVNQGTNPWISNIEASGIALTSTGSSLNVNITGGSGSSSTVNQGTSPWVDNVTQVGGSSITLGQKTSANSLPVVLPSDQIINVSVQPSTKSTYAVTSGSIAPAATPTDIVTISGSGTKTITVLRMELTTTSTSTSNNNWFAVKRSAADSGGTSTSPTIVPYDSNNAAATATVKVYSANPTSLGALIGNVKTIKLFSPPPTGGNATNENISVFDFTDGGVSSGVVLRGTGQTLALNFAGAALPSGMLIAVNIDWIES